LDCNFFCPFASGGKWILWICVILFTFAWTRLAPLISQFFLNVTWRGENPHLNFIHWPWNGPSNNLILRLEKFIGGPVAPTYERLYGSLAWSAISGYPYYRLYFCGNFYFACYALKLILTHWQLICVYCSK
jgi:hypothetical protein